MTTKRSPLPLPAHYNPRTAAEWGYRPDQRAILSAAQAWRAKYGVKPSATDQFRLHLLLIDLQKDFCFPEGSLYVGGRSGTGAIDDTRRIAEFIYRNLASITEITTTLDTHFAFQIFFAPFWVDEDGRSLDEHTLISVNADGRLVNTGLDGKVLHTGILPNPAMAKWLVSSSDGKSSYPWLCRQVEYYVKELAKAKKYTLYLWPAHCLLGSDGHPLVGTIHEARLFHAFARTAQSRVEVKGGNELTENYSVLRPEVLLRWDGMPLAQKNTAFISTLLASDAVVIAGQAASHCVKSSIDDLLSEIVAVDPALARKVYVLKDCMSAVAVPDGKGGFLADFTPQAEEALTRYVNAGMNVVSSTDPIETWPGLKIS